MKIDIFDVGHGACSMIAAPNGRRVMIDCGYRSSEPYWWPSIHFYGQSIDALIITNLDEDHVGDLKDVRKNLRIGSIWMNNTIDAGRLFAMKPDGMQAGVTASYEYLKQPYGLNLALDLSPMTVSLFRHPYGVFTDTNNLSLVVFVQYGQFCMVYPGDLEEEGWKALLGNPSIQSLLRRVNLFMTSHHGRESGYCDEIFQFSRPDAFIISDKEKIHDTQETTTWYRQHAGGLVKILKLPWDVPETRYVFTTRSDHCISIDVNPMGTFVLQINSTRQDKQSLMTAGLAGLLRR